MTESSLRGAGHELRAAPRAGLASAAPRCELRAGRSLRSAGLVNQAVRDADGRHGSGRLLCRAAVLQRLSRALHFRIACWSRHCRDGLNAIEPLR